MFFEMKKKKKKKKKTIRMVVSFITMATRQLNRQQFYKNDIFKPEYLLAALVYMNYSYSALMSNTCFSNAKNKITQNVSDFCNHDNQTMEPSAILQKNDIFKPNYLLTAHVYMNYAYNALTNTCF